MIRLQKAKLKDRTFIVDYVETLEDKTERRHKGVECDQLVHQDAINAFSKLKIHLVNLCDLHEGKHLTIGDDLQGERVPFNSEEHLKNFEVSSFTVSGSEDQEGVVLSGHKELQSGKVINFNTPFTKYMDDEDPYEFSEELATDIQACLYEVEEYLFQGKYAVKQATIDFDTDVNAIQDDEITEVDTEEVSEEEPKALKEVKKGRGKGKKIEMFSNENVSVFSGEAM